ncbi:MAG: response regulator [Elusimicrobia bacterium]|nr:response regulator [Elusimicrobiota bacterium]
MNTGRILVIDSDNEGQRLTALLKTQGHQVQATSVRSYASMLLNTWTPDLILINLFCQSIPALEFLDEIRRLPGAQEQRVLVFSAQPGIELLTGNKPVTEALLSKPVDFNVLGPLLKRCTGEPSPEMRKPVLVVDHDEKSLDIFRMYLEAAYYKPVTVASASSALSRIEDEAPSAIIIDPFLPDANGFELISRFRTDAATSGVPVIAVSELHFNSFQERGMSGYPEIIASAISDEMLLGTVEKLLSGSVLGRDEHESRFKPKVLIADSQPVLLALMTEMLEKSGFEVVTAFDGDEAAERVRSCAPDIAVFDYDLPMKDGFALAQEMRSDSAFSNLPVVLLNALPDKHLKMKGLSLGVDDYLIKPVDADELVARIRMILRRTRQVLDANPLTHLPGNPSIQARIERELLRKTKFAVLYLDLNHFKAFNDVYGFDAGDRVIKSTANLIIEQTKKGGSSLDFIGHIGGDDFIVVTSFDRAEELAARIAKTYDSVAPSFYTEEDRKRGYILGEDRQGQKQHFPFLSISIGVVHNKTRKITSLGQISQIGAELKHIAKMNSGPGSCYIMDRRNDEPAPGSA